ncbi:MAG TPA: YeeE/YedE family protein, partial [Nannocystis exedens]|nr:YeeE/YedE family protein [Nannocystis exedens]
MSTRTIAFITGLIFALGLGISGMTQPLKVRDFLDV